MLARTFRALDRLHPTTRADGTIVRSNLTGVSSMKRLLASSVLAAVLVSTAGCAGMNGQEQRTLSGGAIGAAGGAGIGLLTGAPVAGALIGGAAGAAVGAFCCNEHH